MRTRRALVFGMALGFLGAGLSVVAAQEPGRMMQEHQQQMMMQQQMQQLSQTMDRMARIQQRAQTMEQQMTQAMARLQQNPDLAAMNQEQLRNQERLHTMAQAMNDGAQQMHRAMEQLRNMMGDPSVSGTGDFQRDMDRLRQHWDDVAGQMEQGLQIMDRLRDRLQDRVHVPTEGP